ncbi:hypothetical protein ANANG_G00115890 [Anguilla anguilla]|uniref:NBAS subunit of NRZ tethering complex C-terminal domain-containing protein n=1 Tax=Anguilla anguilla TaxID=7936 RepID=A0A9D3RX72_ANGAN|nr:hypothetical protein ANANG_G00115890 [Anguilla anguilla]
MLMDGRPLGDAAAAGGGRGPLDISRKVVQDAIQRVVSALSGDERALTDGRDPLAVLEGIVTSVHADVQNGGSAVSSDDVLERVFRLSEGDARLLVFYRSQAVLRSCWPHRQLETGDVESEERRAELFAELLDSSAGWDQMQHLMLLLQAWPPPTSPAADASAESPWVKLTRAILSLHGTGGDGDGVIDVGGEVLSMCRSLQPTKHKLPVECIREISGLLLQQAGLLLPALKLMTESSDEQLTALALDRIRGVDKVDESNCDEELLALLLDAGLLIRCVGTAFYPRLAEHLLAHHQEKGWDVEEVCREMRAAGRPAEAGRCCWPTGAPTRASSPSTARSPSSGDGCDRAGGGGVASPGGQSEAESQPGHLSPILPAHP